MIWHLLRGLSRLVRLEVLCSCEMTHECRDVTENVSKMDLNGTESDLGNVDFDSLFCGSILDIVLALFNFAPRNDANTVVVQGRNKVLPFINDLKSLFEFILGFCEHFTLDRLEQLRDGG